MSRRLEATAALRGRNPMTYHLLKGLLFIASLYIALTVVTVLTLAV